MILWCISNYETLNGAGGTLAAGRWHSRGRPIVYFAPNPSTALLEMLVHAGELEARDVPATFRYLKLGVPDDSAAETLSMADLPSGWQDDITITRRFGDRWLAAGQTALLHVPCVIVETMNILLNPAHSDSGRLRVFEKIPYPLDSRLR